MRRLTAWSGGPASGTSGSVETISASGALLFGTASLAGEDGLTIVRIRGNFVARLSVVSGASAGFFGAFGIGKATAAAIAVGVTAVPTPITEDGWDGWIYHTYFQVFGQTATAGDSVQDSLRMAIDSKAMRKLPEDEGIFAAIEVTEVGTCTMEMNFDSRVLLKLP